jgi:hypothetical protein
VSRRIVKYACDCGREFGTREEAKDCAISDEREQFREWFSSEVDRLTDTLWVIDSRPAGEAFVAELRALVAKYAPKEPV